MYNYIKNVKGLTLKDSLKTSKDYERFCLIVLLKPFFICQEDKKGCRLVPDPLFKLHRSSLRVSYHETN